MAGAGVALLLATIICRGRGKAWLFLAAVIFLALNWRTNFVFFSTQPDCASALLAILGLLLWNAKSEKSWRFPMALLLFLCAMLFKQTSAAFSLVPFVHVLLWERPFPVRKLLQAMAPPIFLVAVLGVIALVSPQLFHGLVLAPAALTVHYDQFFPLLLYLLATFPIFFIAMLALLSRGNEPSTRERWICSANIVLIPVSVWTTTKSGGGLNSLLFAYLAMTGLVISQLDRLLTNDAIPSVRRTFRVLVLLLALLCSFFFQFEKTLSVLFLQAGDDKYMSAVETVRQLGPGVISPQDPTIAYGANGYIGNSLFFELDRHSVAGEWPVTLPKSMEEDLAGARHVIEVKSYVPTPMLEQFLSTHGFRREPVPVLENSCYTLWGR
jgi:hypothetical protein